MNRLKDLKPQRKKNPMLSHVINIHNDVICLPSKFIGGIKGTTCICGRSKGLNMAHISHHEKIIIVLVSIHSDFDHKLVTDIEKGN